MEEKSVNRPFSNGFTAICIAACIVFGYLTLYGAIGLKIGFALTFMSILMLIASMVSILPDEHEISVQREINKSKHLKGRL